MKLFVLIAFILTYVLMIAIPKYRHFVALGAAVVFVVAGALPFGELAEKINWNVLLMLTGTMGTVSLFIDSKMPDKMADLLLKKTPNVMWVAVVLSLFAGIVSAFVDNVATVLMIAPVALVVAQRINISPVPLLISIAVSSNLQGAATLVGDTTSIMLGGYADMNFMDFLFMDGRPGICWAVELGAIATVPVIMFIFRKDKEPVKVDKVTEVTNYVPSFLLLGTVVSLIVVSFLSFSITIGSADITNGIICMGFFAIGLVYTLIKGNKALFKKVWGEIDVETLSLLAALFVVIGTLTSQGIIDDISNLFVKFGGSNLFLMYTLIVWGSVLCSAFIDNIPYVATMLPVVQGIAALMGCTPYVLYFGLLVGATLGGNITPIGASANIAAIGILRKNGYEVKTKDFLKIGLPFTLIAVVVGYLFCWFVWAKA